MKFERGEPDPHEMAVINAVATAFGDRGRAYLLLSGPCTCGRDDHLKVVVLVSYRFWHALAFQRLRAAMREAARKTIQQVSGVPANVVVDPMPRSLPVGGLIEAVKP